MNRIVGTLKLESEVGPPLSRLCENSAKYPQLQLGVCGKRTWCRDVG